VCLHSYASAPMRDFLEEGLDHAHVFLYDSIRVQMNFSTPARNDNTGESVES